MKSKWDAVGTHLEKTNKPWLSGVPRAVSIERGDGMCFYSDATTEFGQGSTVKARKPHRCCECNKTIAVGESYGRYSGKCDGNFFVEKTCRRCEYDRVRVVEHELSEGCHWNEAWPPFTNLVEALEESEIGQTLPENVPATFKIGELPKQPTRQLLEVK